MAELTKSKMIELAQKDISKKLDDKVALKNIRDVLGNMIITTKEESIMAKLCPRGKAAAKRKFKVYPSAYANMYASAVCSGKVTPGGKKKRKKAMGGGMMDDRAFYSNGGKVAKGCGAIMKEKKKKTRMV